MFVLNLVVHTPYCVNGFKRYVFTCFEDGVKRRLKRKSSAGRRVRGTAIVLEDAIDQARKCSLVHAGTFRVRLRRAEGGVRRTGYAPKCVRYRRQRRIMRPVLFPRYLKCGYPL